MRLLLFSFLLFLLTGCRNKVEEAAAGADISEEEHSGNYISFPIDSFRHYPLNTEPHSFIRMLRSEKNRLWHFNRRNVLEWVNLDAPDTARFIELPEEAMPLQAKLMKQLKGEVYREWDVVAEEGPGAGLWICNKSNGLYRYLSRDGTFLPSSARSCGKMYVLDHYVVVAENQLGLILMNKAMHILDTITDFPTHEIFDVRETERFGLVINSHQYDPASGTLKKINRIGEVDLPDGFNDFLEQDSFIVYSPGRLRNGINLIVDGRRNHECPFRVSAPGRFIEGHTFRACFADKLVWWDLESLSGESIRLALPMPFSWHWQNDSSRFWVASASGLFSFDKNTGRVHQYPISVSTRLHQFFADEDHLYFLFDGRFSIYSKDYLHAHRAEFDMPWYARQKERYEAVIDSLGLRQTPSFYAYMKKARWLEQHFSAFLAIHPSRLHEYLAPNIWEYELFRNTFFEALLSQEVDSALLEKNYFPFLRALAGEGKFGEVLQLDSIYQSTHKALLEDYGPAYSYGIEELRSLQRERDSLRAVSETREAFQFREALLFRKACRTGWLGENVCDQSLSLRRLEEFLRKYPDSPFSAAAAFYITDINARDPENGMIEAPGGYEAFLQAYPGSNQKAAAMMALLEYYSDNGWREEGLKMAERIKAEFPEVAGSAVYERYLEALNIL
ncbi:MAG: hypothetical protein KDD06_22495 [Phaeodactylibacter sp.]|nr:hypothetical protein [Phaeodactylibacter sp.]MCB9291457.1 hypothetical protein [Lewinellaceae bacterium]